MELIYPDFLLASIAIFSLDQRNNPTGGTIKNRLGIKPDVMFRDERLQLLIIERVISNADRPARPWLPPKVAPVVNDWKDLKKKSVRRESTFSLYMRGN